MTRLFKTLTVEITKAPDKAEFLLRSQGQERRFSPPVAYQEWLEDLESISSESRKKLGDYLCRLVFPEGIPTDPTIINIASDDVAAQALPWELLYCLKDGKYLLRDPQFLLYRSALKDIHWDFEQEVPSPLRALTVLSLPAAVMEDHPVSLLDEWESLYHILSPYQESGGLTITAEERASSKNLREHFVKPGAYQILHFVGHGDEGGKLFLEDSENPEQGSSVGGPELCEIFGKKGLLFAFFNACKTGSGSGQLASLLHHLHTKGEIPFLFGYQGSIEDARAKEVAEKLYQSLFDQKVLERVGEIRRLMHPTEPWWLPVIYLPRDNPVLKVASPPKPPKVAKVRVAKDLVPIGESFVYRFRELREAGDHLREDSVRFILLYGMIGRGKTSLASYIARFYSFLFHRTFVFSLSEESGLSPLQAVNRILTELGKKEAKSLEEGWVTIAGFNILLLLDDVDRRLDEKGMLPPKWEAFFDLLIRSRWKGKALVTSTLDLSLSFQKPGSVFPTVKRMLIGPFTPHQAALFLKKNHIEPDSDVMVFCRDVVGFHPLGMQVLVENGLEKVSKNPSRYLIPCLRDRGMDKVLAFFPDKAPLLKLAVVPYPFPQEYIEAVVTPEVERNLKRFGLLEEDEGDLKISPMTSLFLLNDVSPEQLSAHRMFAQEWFAKEVKEEALSSRSDFFLLSNAFSLSMDSDAVDRALNFGRLLTSLRPSPIFSYPDLFQSLMALSDRVEDQRNKGALLRSLGVIFVESGLYEIAEPILEKAKKAFETLGDKQGIANTLENLGVLASSRGDYDQAEKSFAQALKAFQDLGDKSGIAGALMNLGNLASSRGDYDQAEKSFTQALKVFQDLGVKPGIANTFMNLGILAGCRGDYDQAEKSFTQALKVFQDLGDKQGIANTLSNLGNITSNRGDYDQAEKSYVQALKTFQDLGDKQGIANTLTNLGTLAKSRGDYDQAEKSYSQALKALQDLGDKNGIAQILGNLGILARSRGDYDQAEKSYVQALKAFQDLGDKHGFAMTIMNLGNLAQSRGDYDQAEKSFGQALKTFQDLGDKQGAVNALRHLGTLALERWRKESRKEHLEEGIKKLLMALETMYALGDKRGAGSIFHQLNALAREAEDFDHIAQSENPAAYSFFKSLLEASSGEKPE